MKRLQLVIIILLCSLSGCVFHPYGNLIGIKALKTVTKTCDSIFVKVTMQTSDAIPFISYYELSGTSDFTDTFNFNEWTISAMPVHNSPILVLYFSEEWTLELYSDGTAWAHNGYARFPAKQDCYFIFPYYNLDAIINYVEKNSIQHYWGDSIINSATVHH